LTAGGHEKLADAARALNEAHAEGLRAGGRLPPLFFLTDEVRTPDPLAAIAQLPEGCGVLFRHYEARERGALARDVATLCRAEDRVCLIAGDVTLAREAGANGVHLPEHMLRSLTARPDAGLVTAAVHGAEGLVLAELMDIDAVFLAPVFATASHAEAKALGAIGFKALVAQTRLAVYALGGITAENAGALAGSGAIGLAAIGALL